MLPDSCFLSSKLILIICDSIFGRELCKDLFNKWSKLDNSCFSVETVSGGITNLREYKRFLIFIWLFTVCIHRYGNNVLSSFVCNMRDVIISVSRSIVFSRRKLYWIFQFWRFPWRKRTEMMFSWWSDYTGLTLIMSSIENENCRWLWCYSFFYYDFYSSLLRRFVLL